MVYLNQIGLVSELEYDRLFCYKGALLWYDRHNPDIQIIPRIEVELVWANLSYVDPLLFNNRDSSSS